MKLWLLIITTMLFQELVSSNAVLLQALQLHYNIWVIHAIFVCSTLVGIWIGYYIGQWVQKTFHHNKAVSFIQKHADRVDHFMGENGIRLSLIFLSFIDFNFMDSFLSSWLKKPFWEVATFLFIGNLLWYICQWLLILGVHTFIPNPYTAIYTIVGISIIITIVVRYIGKKIKWKI